MTILSHTSPDAGSPDGKRRRWRHARSRVEWERIQLRHVIVPAAAAILWVVGFLGADPREMGQLGLVSLFNVATGAALVLLLGGFLVGLYRHRPGWVLGTHLVTYLVLIHGTPAVLYGTPRYSWSYKHVGIVDYILRTGGVDPTIAVGDIYHNWPGFFAGSALITSAADEQNALQLALWAPLAFNLMNLVVLRYLFRGLTTDARLVWLATMFFFITNWVGQDYFSPQAMAYLLYLALIGIVLRRTRVQPMLTPFVVLVAAVAVSHQITPMMIVLALFSLVVFRRIRGWYLPVLALVMIGAWALTGARHYTIPNLQDLSDGVGRPVTNAAETLDKSSSFTGAAELVVWAGRFIVVAAFVLALIGLVRTWRYRKQWTPLLLMAAPAALVVTTGFGGEVLLRTFLFSAPFIAFLAAAACLSRDGTRLAPRGITAAAVMTALLLPAFLLAYYGKERQNYLTPAEVQAAAWVDTHARSGSLLVEGSRNYPNQFLDYEKFTYVPIDREPSDSIHRMLDNPPVVLAEWLDNARYTQAYILISRGQKIAAEDTFSLPPHALDRIEHALRGSSKFRVAYETRDATVFTLATQPEDR